VERAGNSAGFALAPPPHNTFLQALIELGIPGFALFIGVIVSSLRYLRVPTYTKPENPNLFLDEPRTFARALAIGLIRLCISGFFLSELCATVFWMLVTLSCAVGIVCRMLSSVRGTAPSTGTATRERTAYSPGLNTRAKP
jgi:O-antigen ligase